MNKLRLFRFRTRTFDGSVGRRPVSRDVVGGHETPENIQRGRE
jgi:hypothetical protein